MTRPVLWKRALAVPAALSLALGGALLASAPAVADVGDPLVVVSPAEGATVEARTFTVSGTGSDGQNVSVIDVDDDIAVLGTVLEGGEWSVTITYPGDAATAQEITVTQQTTPGDPESEESVVRAFSLPAAEPIVSEPLVVTSPEDGDVLDDRNVDFTGTATVGSEVVVSVEDLPVGGGIADGEGDFAFPVFFPVPLEGEVTVVVTATDPEGVEAEPVTLQLTLPAPLAAPVITSPTNGQRIVSDRVTFTGTGIPGENIVLAAVPTDLLEELENEFSATQAAPANPEDPILVDANGSWSVTVLVAPDDYTAVATHVELDDQNQLVALTSLPSAPVEFSVVAPVASAPGGTGQLAATGGVDDNALAASAAALMVLTGAALIVLRRKRGLVG